MAQSGKLLAETGDAILKEDGGFILLDFVDRLLELLEAIVKVNNELVTYLTILRNDELVRKYE